MGVPVQKPVQVPSQSCKSVPKQNCTQVASRSPNRFQFRHPSRCAMWSAMPSAIRRLQWRSQSYLGLDNKLEQPFVCANLNTALHYIVYKESNIKDWKS